MITRRDFLKKTAVLSTMAITPPILFSNEYVNDRIISLHNIHTDEKLTTTFWAEGRYDLQSLADINNILRDFRTNMSINMDVQLIELLSYIQKITHSKNSFEVISGYRHPASNSLLRDTTVGVAKKSLHMEGKAIDINLPGVDLPHLKNIAIALNVGGVGYYPASNFIHVDTGRVRTW